MSTILFMRDVTITLRASDPGTDPVVEYNCDCSSVAIEATPGDEVTYPTLCPDGNFSSVGRTSYALHIVAGQNWEDPGGLARLLWDHDGELFQFQFQAHGSGVVPSATQPGMTGEVRLVAGSYGGEVDTYPEVDVTLPCSTKPTIAVAAFPAAAEAPAEAVAA